MDIALGSVRVPEALRQAGLAVELHNDHFPDNKQAWRPGRVSVPDRVWLRATARRGWIVLTKDRDSLTRDEKNVRAIIRHRAAVFTLTNHQMPGPEQAQVLVDCLPRILSHSRTKKRPFIAAITRSRDVRWVFYPHGKKPVVCPSIRRMGSA